MKLDYNDLSMAVRRLPKKLATLMLSQEWTNKIFIGGGYLRCIVSGEKINDIDLFVSSESDASLLAGLLCDKPSDLVKTENAFTVKGKLPIQIIKRWLFEKPEDVSNSFDFTVCCAVIWKSEKGWDSFCDNRFYIDLSSKRLVYRCPIRNEDAGGSMLRVLKYYQRGYRIPLNSLSDVIARLIRGINTNDLRLSDESRVSFVICGLLREVDPSIDIDHESHLPSLNQSDTELETE